MIFSFFGSYNYVYLTVYGFNRKEVGLTFIAIVVGMPIPCDQPISSKYNWQDSSSGSQLIASSMRRIIEKRW